MDDEKNNSEYLSCNIIEHGFDAQINSINLCCRQSNEDITDKIVLMPNFNGNTINWDDFFQITDKLRNIQKQGKILPQCQECIYLKKNNWDNEHYINTININNWVKCNASCIYCDRKQYSHIKEYKIYPIIKSLIENNYLKVPADITIAGGEPCLSQDFNKIMKLFLKNKIKNIRVLTNAIKYNKYIEKGIKEGIINILVSTDSGTKNTYKRIKLTDKHNAVWKNIAKYAANAKETSLVQTKYIIIAYYNDNKSEIKEFIKKNIEANIKTCCIDIEINIFYYYKNNKIFLQKMYDLFLYAKEIAKETGLEVLPFDRMKLAINKINNI